MSIRSIQWDNDREFSVEGVRFLCSFDDYSRRTDRERFVLLKHREDLRLYAELFAQEPPRTMLEFGIFQGGSPALFALWLDLEKFVGIDLCDPVNEFDDFCKRHPVGSRIHSYYRVSQTDKRRVDEIIAGAFGATGLDAVVDDASHLYGPTRRAFEIAFPHLKPGGTYVVEDWGWAHWPGSKFFLGETAMSMFVMELVMLCASRPDIVREVRVFPSFVFVRKSEHAPTFSNFRLDELYTKRGMEIIGAGQTTWRRLGKLFGSRVLAQAKRRVARLQKRMRFG